MNKYKQRTQAGEDYAYTIPCQILCIITLQPLQENEDQNNKKKRSKKQIVSTALKRGTAKHPYAFLTSPLPPLPPSPHPRTAPFSPSLSFLRPSLPTPPSHPPARPLRPPPAAPPPSTGLVDTNLRSEVARHLTGFPLRHHPSPSVRPSAIYFPPSHRHSAAKLSLPLTSLDGRPELNSAKEEMAAEKTREQIRSRKAESVFRRETQWVSLKGFLSSQRQINSGVTRTTWRPDGPSRWLSRPSPRGPAP